MKLFTDHARGRRRRSIATPAIGLVVLGMLATLAFAGSALSAKSSGSAIAAQATIDLGGAESFGALSFTAMTNAGLDTVVNGNIGSQTSIDAGVTHPGFAAYGAGSIELANAQAGLLNAYNFAEAQTSTGDITGMNLAGKSLGPGVYDSSSGIQISGPIALTLDGGGNASSVFIFRAASSGDLTVDPTSSVSYTNGAQPCNVFWKVNSAFLKNTGSTFVGTILALTQITLTDNITVEGRVLARNADVTFIHDVVNKPSTCVQQADVDAAARAAADAATVAAQAAAEQAAAADAAAKAAADRAAAAKTAAEEAAAAKEAADKAAAAKEAADKAAAAKEAADKAAAAKEAADKAASAKAAADQAAAADKARARKAQAARVAAAKLAAERKAARVGHALPAIRRVALTG